jgi:hypothetical protein
MFKDYRNFVDIEYSFYKTVKGVYCHLSTTKSHRNFDTWEHDEAKRDIYNIILEDNALITIYKNNSLLMRFRHDYDNSYSFINFVGVNQVDIKEHLTLTELKKIIRNELTKLNKSTAKEGETA